MVKTDNGIQVHYKMVKDPDDDYVKYKDLMKTSHHAVSCTTGILSVEVKYVVGKGKKAGKSTEHTLTLVDTAG